MAPTVGSQNVAAGKLGLDTAETNPVLLRKMQQWKQSKHKQRIMEARRGAKAKGKVGVPFARSGFAKKEKLPPVDSRAHRDMLDESMGELSEHLDNLADVHVPRLSQRQRQKDSGQARQRRRPAPTSMSDRPDFDCTPLDNRGDVSQSGLKIRREIATREPPRKPKQSRALEGIIEQRPDLDSAPSPSTDRSSSTSSDAQPADSEDLTKAQQTIAQLRKLLRDEKEKTALRVQEAQSAARQKTEQLSAALAQTKTQLRMLQKQLHKAREEAVAAQQAVDLSATATAKRDASTEPDIGENFATRGFVRIRLRPRSEQRARDAMTPPSRIPEPRSLRTPTVRLPTVDQVQAPAVLPHTASSIGMDYDEHSTADVQIPVAQSAAEAPLKPSPSRLTAGLLNADFSDHAVATSKSDDIGESAAGDEVELEGEELIRLERGLSTSTSCSFCVTGSPPQAIETSAMEAPEVEGNGLSSQELLELNGQGEGKTIDAYAADADIVKLTDRALDGVARALDAITTTSESMKSEAGYTAQYSAEESWGECDAPAVDTTRVGAAKSGTCQDAHVEGEVVEAYDSEEDELPVEIVTR